MPAVSIVAIINLSPDSFSGDGHTRVSRAVAHAAQAVMDGAAVLDIGAESTRPGSHHLPAEDELARLLPALTAIRQALPAAVLSVDTSKAIVARAALEAGANWINDVHGGADAGMLSLVAQHGCPVVLMHNAARAAALEQTATGVRYAAEENENDNYLQILLKKMDALAARALAAGVKPENIILDPGLGFGKSVRQNLQILGGLPRLAALRYPLFIGASRKSFIGDILGEPADGRLYGTLATTCWSALHGARYIRVHDVKPMVQAVRVLEAIVDACGTTPPAPETPPVTG